MRRSRIFSATIAAVMVGGTFLPHAHAAPSIPLGVETTVPSNQWVAVNTQYNPAESRTTGMQALQQVRGQMWDKNVPFDGTTLRAAAAAQGFLTRDAYVRGAASDKNLVKISVQRGVEQMDGNLNHNRPAPHCSGTTPCGDTWSAKIRNVQSWGENLAWSTNGNLREAIVNQWASADEQRALYASNGHANSRNGHLHTLLDPSNRAYGFANVTFRNNRGNVVTVQVTSAGKKVTAADDSQDAVKHEWVHRAANGGETPTGPKTGTPPALGGAFTPPLPGVPVLPVPLPGNIDSANMPISSDTSGSLPGGITVGGGAGTVIGVILAVLSALGAVWQVAHHMGLI